MKQSNWLRQILNKYAVKIEQYLDRHNESAMDTALKTMAKQGKSKIIRINNYWYTQLKSIDDTYGASYRHRMDFVIPFLHCIEKLFHKVFFIIIALFGIKLSKWRILQNIYWYRVVFIRGIRNMLFRSKEIKKLFGFDYEDWHSEKPRDFSKGWIMTKVSKFLLLFIYFISAICLKILRRKDWNIWE